MRMSNAFSSNYLRADDLQGRTYVLTVQEVKLEDVGDGHKPVVYFQGASKGLVLNKTNGMTIAGFYGDDTDMWLGRPIELFSMKVQFQNGMVDAIRVRIPANAPTVATHPSPLPNGPLPQTPPLPTAAPPQQSYTPPLPTTPPLPSAPPRQSTASPTGMPQAPTSEPALSDLDDEIPF